MNLSEITTAVTGIVIIFVFWRQGANTASAQVIATYREQVKQLTDQVASLTSKVGELTGALNEKDDRIKTLEAIATNRNPEMETFMKNMTDALEQGKIMNAEAQEYMKNSTEYLHNIKNALTVRALDDQIEKKRNKIKSLSKKL
jgi:prefoldin subunit 5